jgi:hypothetical protein
VPDDALLVDDVGDTLCVLRIGRVASAVCETHRAIGVTEQRKGIAELVGEGFVVGGGVETATENFYVLGDELLLLVTEPVPLDCSTRGVGLRVEPQNDLLAEIIRQADGRTVVSRDFEVRC